jgi:hypothetical protein
MAIILFIFVVQANNQHLEFENGYIDRLGSSIIRILNPFRQLFGKMPIWIVPYYRYWNHKTGNYYYGHEQLQKAIRLCDNIKSSLERLNWSRQHKKAVLHRAYRICENISTALWKLARLEQSENVIGKFGEDKDGKGLKEIRALSEKIREEIQYALETLTSFSVYLARLALGDTSVSTEINSLAEQLDTSGQKLVEVTQSDGQKFTKSTSYSSIWSYTAVFVIVVTTFSISSRYVPNYAFAITVAGSLLGLLVIGILKLRDSEKISESSFAKIVIEFLKSIRLIK